MKFNWVTLKVKDMEKSLDFYTNILGLDIDRKFGNQDHQIAMLGKSNATKIELFCDANVENINPGDGVSIGFEMNDSEILLAKLNENGYDIIGPITPNQNIRFFFVNDPDGYTVQLVEQATTILERD